MAVEWRQVHMNGWGEHERSGKEYWSFINCCIWVDERRLVCACHCVCVCMCVTWLLFERWYCKLQYLRFCLFEMYINVVFVIRCLYSTVSLTLVREQHFIRIIYYYYYAWYPTWQTQDTWFSLISWLWTLYLELSPPPWSQALLNFFIFQKKLKPFLFSQHFYSS